MTVLSPSAARVASMLESLYSAIEGLDSTGYRLSASDGWHQARAGQLDINATEHLEAWIEITGWAFTRAGRDIEAVIHTAARSTRDNTSTSQASILAAALDLEELLVCWCHPDTDARSVPTGSTFQPLNQAGDWYEIQTAATILLPRGV